MLQHCKKKKKKEKKTHTHTHKNHLPEAMNNVAFFYIFLAFPFNENHLDPHVEPFSFYAHFNILHYFPKNSWSMLPEMGPVLEIK